MRFLNNPIDDLLRSLALFFHLLRHLYHITMRTAKCSGVDDCDVVLVIHHLFCAACTLICTGQTVCHRNVDDLVIRIFFESIHYITDGRLRRLRMQTVFDMLIEFVIIHMEVFAIPIPDHDI